MHTRHRYLCMQVFVKCRVVHNNLHCKPSKMTLWLPTYGRLDEHLYGRLIGRLSLGPGQWLWLFKRSGQGQSQPRPTFWLGLAWPDFGLASGFRPRPAQHYLQDLAQNADLSRQFNYITMNTGKSTGPRTVE